MMFSRGVAQIQLIGFIPHQQDFIYHMTGHDFNNQRSIRIRLHNRKADILFGHNNIIDADLYVLALGHFKTNHIWHNAIHRFGIQHNTMGVILCDDMTDQDELEKLLYDEKHVLGYGYQELADRNDVYRIASRIKAICEHPEM